MILIPHNKLIEVKCQTTWMDSEYRGSLVIQLPSYDILYDSLNFNNNLPITAMLCNDDKTIIYPNISIYGISRDFGYNSPNKITMTFMVIPW